MKIINIKISALVILLILKTNEIKPQDVVVLELKTANLAPGIYIDKVIINNDANSGFYVRIKVN